jgi:hypothetical protein
LVTLRVWCLVFLVAVAGSLADGDAVPDGDLLPADQDVFDEEPQDALALCDAGATGAGSQLGEEAFQIISEFEVSLLVGELGVQGIKLAAQVSLAGAQVRHPGPQLIDGDQLLLERLDHAGDRGRGLDQGEFQPVALPGGRIGGAGLLQALADLRADQRRAGEQVRDVVPDDGAGVVGADWLVAADPPALVTVVAGAQAPGRGRDRSCRRPPAQIPACGTTALGSCLGCERGSALQGRGAGCVQAGAIASRGEPCVPSSGDDAGCGAGAP